MTIHDITQSGRLLHERFLSIGNLNGKTASEIKQIVGEPSSTSSMNYGRSLLQWQATGCHMAIVFDADDNFVEISHQYAQYVPQSVIAAHLKKDADEKNTSMIIGILIFAVLVVIFVLIKFG